MGNWEEGCCAASGPDKPSSHDAGQRRQKARDEIVKQTAPLVETARAEGGRRKSGA